MSWSACRAVSTTSPTTSHGSPLRTLCSGPCRGSHSPFLQQPSVSPVHSAGQRCWIQVHHVVLAVEKQQEHGMAAAARPSAASLACRCWACHGQGSACTSAAAACRHCRGAQWVTCACPPVAGQRRHARVCMGDEGGRMSVTSGNSDELKPIQAASQTWGKGQM